MAGRKGSPDVDDTSAEDEGDDVLEAEDLDETSLDDAFADDEEDLEVDVDLEDEDPSELTATPVEAAPDADEEVAAPAEASFDDEDDEGIVAAVTGEDDDQGEIEGLRDGEFVCRSCFMAKRDTQLADPEQLLCRDCA